MRAEDAGAIATAEDAARREVEDALAAQARVYLEGLWERQVKVYEGREFLWECVLSPELYADIQGDVPAVYRALGRRSVWLEVLRRVNEFPEQAKQMQDEGMARARKRRADSQAKHASKLREARMLSA